MFKLSEVLMTAIIKKISNAIITDKSEGVLLAQCGCQGYCGSGCSGEYCANGCDDHCSAQVYRAN